MIAGIRQVISDLKIEDPNVALVVNDDLETYASIIALWMEGKDTCLYIHGSHWKDVWKL